MYNDSESPSHRENSLVKNKAKIDCILQLARRKGEGILGDAKTRAVKIEEQANEEGYKKGYDEGLEKGREEGRLEYEKKINEFQERIKTAEIEYEKKLLSMAANLEPKIKDLVMVVVRQVLKREMEHDEDLVLRTIRDAVKELARRDRVTLLVSQKEIEKIAFLKDELMSYSNVISEMEILPGADIEPGGCVIDSPSGIVDAKLESQLEVINDILNS